MSGAGSSSKPNVIRAFGVDDDGKSRGGVRPKAVKNKAPAKIQITAEQILREAWEQQEPEAPPPPKQKVMDREELEMYKLQRRKEFEDYIRRNRLSLATWIKYAQWEESQNEFERARSIYERVLDVNYRDMGIWIKYAEMEMKNKFVDRARNVWDRAVTLLPRINQFWYKYAYMEEILGNIAAARQVFERWLDWHPDLNGYTSFAKFELRYNEYSRARSIYDRMVSDYNTVEAWLKYARFEERQRDVVRTRAVYEAALEKLGPSILGFVDSLTATSINTVPEAIIAAATEGQKLFISFAKFEEKCREVERARAIFKYGLDNLPKIASSDLYKTYVEFEKVSGDRDGVENVVLGKRRFHYEELLKEDVRNYDIWFDYVRLEESVLSESKQKGRDTLNDIARVREVYERAISNVPPSSEKRFWRRYIYLWINYALFEELEADAASDNTNEDDDEIPSTIVDNVNCRAIEVYRTVLKLLPHSIFSFSKIWLLAAQCEIRRLDVKSARKLLGNALGVVPPNKKSKIFAGYIDLELQLGEVDRCRTLYQKWLESSPDSVKAWTRFAQLEQSLGEIERARAIFELAVSQGINLDLPEVVWKEYIDFEINEGEIGRARQLYRRLLLQTGHVRVWISFAKFEAAAGNEANDSGATTDGVTAARAVFDEAFTVMGESVKDAVKSNEVGTDIAAREERLLLLEAWRDFEVQVGDRVAIQHVVSKFPKRVKKRRQLSGGAFMNNLEDAEGFEEYLDYIFPDEAAVAAGGLKILERAKLWKQKKLEAQREKLDAKSLVDDDPMEVAIEHE